MAVVTIMGPIGAGKTEQACRLAEETGWKTFSTGELLRRDDSKEVLKASKTGKLAPTVYVQDLVLEKIASHDASISLILDGSPRMIAEAERLDNELPKMGRKIDLVIFLNVSEEEVQRRLAMRGRHDDEPDIVKVRWQEYQNDTRPVIEHYKRKGIVCDLDGNRSLEEIHEEIMIKLKEVGLVD